MITPPSAPPSTRQQAGLRAKRMGELFENLFASSCARRGLAVTRIPDGCKQIGARRILRVKTPFDWVISFSGKTALIDTKTINAKALPNSKIDQNQLKHLLKHELAGGIAGYVAWLRTGDQIIFIPATTLAESILNRGSISPLEKGVIQLGSSKFLDAFKIFGHNSRLEIKLP